MARKPKGRILIAEDEESFSSALRALLESHGYECEAARDAEEAKRKLLARGFNLLVSDLRMPGNEGLELIRWIQNEAIGLPVVLLTGFPSMESAIRSVELPVVAYLVKPPDFAELLSVIEREVTRHHAYVAFKTGEGRFATVLQNLGVLESGLQANRSEELAMAIDKLKNLIRVFAQMVGSFQKLSVADPRHQVPPRDFRLDAFESALQHTVYILDKTRGQFKSRELGQLRRHLEQILDDATPDRARPLSPGRES